MYRIVIGRPRSGETNDIQHALTNTELIYDKIYTYANVPNEPKIEQLKSVYDNIKKSGYDVLRIKGPNDLIVYDSQSNK